MKGKKIRKKLRKVKTYRIRSRVAAAFFVILSGSVMITGGAVWLLEKHGISLQSIENPIFGILTVSVICMILSDAASYFAMNQVFEPMEQISKASRKVAKGDYSVQLEYNGSIEEFRNTVDNFNKMIRELGSVEMIRNDFIANVSHEFKTPLSSINGYVMLLQDPELTEEERNEYIQKTFFNIEKLNDLTENILRLSKLENQNCLPEPVSYRLDEQIREAIVLLEPKWSKKHLALDLDLQNTVYSGQQALMLQVWINLIGNAIKFSDVNDEISVKLSVFDDKIKVIVSDNGIGMSSETQSHIFDKFYQGDTSRRSQGNGLGLALCKEILNRCGGRIYVTSELGNGSTFMVILNNEK